MTTKISMLAIDLAKGSFQVCVVGADGTVLYNRVLARTRLATLLAEQPACATSHHWGRVAQGHGHEVRLIPPLASRFHEEETGALGSGRVGELPFSMETIAMQTVERTATDGTGIFISLELSRSTWLVTTLSAPLGAKMSRYQLQGGDLPGLPERVSDPRNDVHRRAGQVVPAMMIQEAGLDGFRIHRALTAEGIESHVVDPASIAVSRRHRGAKTTWIDGEALLRTLMAWKRGERSGFARWRGSRRQTKRIVGLFRELKALGGDRIRHVNRLKGLFFAQGIGGYEPRNKDRRECLEALRTGDGRPLPPHLKALALRELEVIELLNLRIDVVKAERDSLLSAAATANPDPEPVRMLLGLKGIGPGFAGALWSEGLFRTFENRRQVAAYAGLAPTPWKSGTINHEQGVSKAGNPRPRAIAVEMAWLWPRHQPESALACWYHDRVRQLGPRSGKVSIVALARKLLVALWKYATSGVSIEGASLKTN